MLSKRRVAFQPFRVYLRVTRTCNARCPYCPSWQMPKEFPQGALVSRVLAEVAEVKAKEVRFTGGEPALFPGFFDAVACAKGLGLGTSVITNGTLFMGKLLERALAAPLDAVVLSVDTPDAKAHDAMRVIDGLLDTSVKGLRALRQARPATRLEVNMVVSRASVGDVEAAIRFCAAEGVSTLNLLPVKDSPALHCSQEQMEAHNAAAPALLRLARQLGVSVLPLELNLFGLEKPRVEASARGDYPPRNACYVPYREAFVDLITGLVWPCNSTPYAHRNGHTCGSVFEQSFAAIWNGPTFDKLRKAFRLAHPVPCSTRCDPANGCSSDAYREEVDRLLATAKASAA